MLRGQYSDFDDELRNVVQYHNDLDDDIINLLNNLNNLDNPEGQLPSQTQTF